MLTKPPVFKSAYLLSLIAIYKIWRLYLKMDQAQLEPEKYYHIYNRGNNKEAVFFESENYAHFLHLWKKYINPVADTYAYCLLNNHYHFLIKTKAADELHGLAAHNCNYDELFIKQFSNLFNAYVKAINKSYSRVGSLFQRPFKRKEVSDEAYFTKLVYYIHANPQKHGLVANFAEWPHSSYRGIISDRPTKLQREKVLEWFNGRDGYLDFHETYDLPLEQWDD